LSEGSCRLRLNYERLGMLRFRHQPIWSRQTQTTDLSGLCLRSFSVYLAATPHRVRRNHDRLQDLEEVQARPVPEHLLVRGLVPVRGHSALHQAHGVRLMSFPLETLFMCGVIA